MTAKNIEAMAMSNFDNTICKAVGRTGPLLNVAIVPGGGGILGFVRATLICTDKANDANWLFAAPLASPSKQRVLDAGLNIFDFSIIGYTMSGPQPDIFDRTLSNMIAMILPRLRGIAVDDIDQSKRLSSACLEMFRYLISVQNNDSSELEHRLAHLDGIISAAVLVRLVDTSGETKDYSLPLTAAGAMEWIANYASDRLLAEAGTLVAEL